MSEVPGVEAHLAALASLPDVGPSRLRWLLGLGDPRSVWQRLAAGRVVPAVEGNPDGSPKVQVGRELLQAWREHADAPWPQRMQARLDRLGVQVLHAESLPARLRDDHEPPGVLFGQGALPPPDAPAVAVVGTRRASTYGLRTAECLGRDLSVAGVVVVSGLALGIDAAAHRGAIAGATPPLAVIGAGHDRPCPARNRELAGRIARRGSLLSEVPPGVSSAPWRFPARNRCIAALADVVVVVESPPSGGSMLTVAEALDRDRAVMAVPGPIDRRTSQGCHLLIRDGAQVCTGADDVLALLGLLGARVAPSTDIDPLLGPVAARVLELVSDAPLPADAVLAGTGVGLSELSGALVELEAAGLVARCGGWIERTSVPLGR